MVAFPSTTEEVSEVKKVFERLAVSAKINWH
jgi:hypothetical protein